MITQPGSFVWLVVHDMRLNWRRFADMLGVRPLLLIGIVVSGAAVLHLAAGRAAIWQSPYVHGDAAGSGPFVAIVVCIFTWMIAQSLFGAMRALYDRGDLDLLLGSPLPARRIFAAKAASITTSTLGSIAFLALPIANTGAAVDRLEWLGIYPALIGLALIATSIALLISIGLFFLVGPRRARMYTQITGAVIGGSFVLGAQVIAMLPRESRLAVSGWFRQAANANSGDGRSLVRLPLDTASGDMIAALLLLGIATIMFAVAVNVLGEQFARASIAASGAAAVGDTASPDMTAIKFSSGVGRSLRLKEWRLLLRDPSVFTQLGLQIVYTIPIAVVLLNSEMLPTALALAPAIVLMVAQVAASLAWITVSGEDAPELIQSAPVESAAVDRGKLSTIALPLFLVLALPLFGFALISVKWAIMAGVFAGAAGLSTALVNLWHPMPGNRRGMLRRHSQSKLIALVEHGLAVLWSFAVVFAMVGSVIALMPIALVGFVLILFRARHLRTKSPRARLITAALQPIATVADAH